MGERNEGWERERDRESEPWKLIKRKVRYSSVESEKGRRISALGIRGERQRQQFFELSKIVRTL
ncbi:conserved hypothetical protein [Ricinus communis]|uniref:Uncharacterized protein n=1 Tax=Ricinus communis TaxID=3988 RepID=B9SPR4_RICCO|nr:conserved hypothetical protein [Ricinus communis]